MNIVGNAVGRVNDIFLQDWSAMKNIIYWSVYIFLIGVGIVFSVNEVLPIHNTMIFLLGVMCFWTGVSIIIGVHTFYAQKYIRKYQMMIAVIITILGISWMAISCTALCDEAIPMLLVSLPFLLSLAVVAHLHKYSKSNR